MRPTFAWLLLALSSIPTAASAEQTYLCPDNGPQFNELRIYDINRDNRDPFHERFAEHALRFMRKYGFRIVDMWESDTGEKLQLVYVLSWPDGATRDAKWKAFRADPEWAEIRKRSVEAHGDLMLASAHEQPMKRVSYSPQCQATAKPHKAGLASPT